jgi:hypothetical protein
MRTLAPEAGTEHRYATQVGQLWSGLARTLTRLEALAEEPQRLDDDSVDMLRRLQYRLHTACEHAYGIAPPAAAQPNHAELAAALAGARDATAEVVEAIEAEGCEAAQLLVHEWRGALFRVRLARLRLAGPRQRRPEEPKAERAFRAPLAALVLALLGAAAFTVGAALGTWPLWAAGLLAVGGSFLAYKP